MEIVKYYLLSVLLLFSVGLLSQSQEDLMSAFKKSYDFERSGDYSSAIGELKKVYNSDSYEVNLRLGWLKYLGGLFTESIPYYEQCISLKPLSIEARLGIVYPAGAMGNWSHVEKTYIDILEIDQENSIALYRLGLIYYGREDYKEAAKYFDRILNQYPFDYDSLIMSAWTYLKMGEMRKAKVLFNKVMLYSPNDKSALEGLELIK